MNRGRVNIQPEQNFGTYAYGSTILPTGGAPTAGAALFFAGTLTPGPAGYLPLGPSDILAIVAGFFGA